MDITDFLVGEFKDIKNEIALMTVMLDKKFDKLSDKFDKRWEIQHDICFKRQGETITWKIFLWFIAIIFSMVVGAYSYISHVDTRINNYHLEKICIVPPPFENKDNGDVDVPDKAEELNDRDNAN